MRTVILTLLLLTVHISFAQNASPGDDPNAKPSATSPTTPPQEETSANAPPTAEVPQAATAASENTPQPKEPVAQQESPAATTPVATETPKVIQDQAPTMATQEPPAAAPQEPPAVIQEPPRTPRAAFRSAQKNTPAPAETNKPFIPKTSEFDYSFASAIDKELTPDQLKEVRTQFCKVAEFKNCHFPNVFLNKAAFSPNINIMIGTSVSAPLFLILASFNNKKLTRKQAIDFLQGLGERARLFSTPLSSILARAKPFKKRQGTMLVAEEWEGSMAQNNFRIFLLTDPKDNFSYLAAFSSSKKEVKPETDKAFESVYTLLDRIPKK